MPAWESAGIFQPRITLTFTTKHAPGVVDLSALPKSVKNPTSSVTGLWATKLNATENNDWSWTYTTGCEKWVDAFNNDDGQAKSAGDITGKVCKPQGGGTTTSVPPTTTTPPPTTTTTAPPTTSAAPTTGASSGGSGGGNPAVTTTVQQVSTVPVGAPETGGGATAGVQDEWLLIVGGALLIAAAFSLFYLRRRPQDQK